MNRLNKIFIFIFFISVCLLFDVSYAFPDSYFFNNFLYGQSPYYYTGSADNSSVYYYPNNGSENNYQGIVTSFNSSLMNGNIPDTSVPAVDLDYTVGKYFVLPAESCFVLYTSSGSILSVNSSGTFHYNALGFNQPYVTSRFNNDASYNFVSTNGVSRATINLSDFNASSMDAFYLPNKIVDGSATIYLGDINSNISSSVSRICFIYNLSDSPCYFTVSSDIDLNSIGSDVPLYEAPYQSIHNFSGILTYSDNYTTYSESSSNVYFIPHIKANLDVYMPVRNVSTSFATFTLNTYYNITTSLSYDSSGYVLAGFDYIDNTFYEAISTSSAFIERDNTKVPFFINNTSGIPYLFQYAVSIKNGYVSIDNYEELVALMKEAGVGSSDLTRITQLLEEINTGGATGEETKELIGLLEQYHDQIQQQANFSGATDVFDTYKNILEFTEDMHWLVTANNSLFEYFAGFIMLCAMFLFLSRVMR